MRNPTANELLDAVLELQEEERIEVVEALLDSLQTTAPRLDESLRALVERRSAELDSGRVASILWEEVKRRGRAAIDG